MYLGVSLTEVRDSAVGMTFAIETAVRKLIRIDIPPRWTLSGFIHTSILLHNMSFVLELRLCKTFLFIRSACLRMLRACSC